MSLAVAGLALFVGLLLSSALYFALVWPQRDAALDDPQQERLTDSETGASADD